MTHDAFIKQMIAAKKAVVEVTMKAAEAEGGKAGEKIRQIAEAGVVKFRVNLDTEVSRKPDVVVVKILPDLEGEDMVAVEFLSRPMIRPAAEMLTDETKHRLTVSIQKAVEAMQTR